jgi:hypothetical protein
MSRTITISTAVFAALWAQRRDGEETEDAILRRVLGCAKTADPEQSTPAVNGSGGVNDTRNGVHFPRGFVAFRTYKRREYEAVAQDGQWLRTDTGKLYPTLNQLNSSIAAGVENIWNGNWKYRADDGSLRSINELRP